MAFHDWPDGKAHSISYAQELIRRRNNAGNPLTLPAPPVGTYDPALDYNAAAANRGYNQTFNDAQTAYEQGQEDYGLGLGNLTTNRDRTLADLLTSEQGLNTSYGQQTADLGRQYGILGHQQAQSAAQHGITSAGLLGKSQQIRAANQGNDQFRLDTARGQQANAIDTARARAGQDFSTGKTVLDLQNARQFGGFNGNTLLDPVTHQPLFGSLLTNVTRAGAENTAYQAGIGGQRATQAAAGGYVSPLTQPSGSVAIGRTPLTPQMYQNGLLLDALLGGRPRSTAGL